MKNLNWLAASFVILVSAVSCSQDEVVSPVDGGTASSDPSVQNNSNARLNYWSVYVMDARFSRETCATGPGVCFKDQFGGVWDYAFVDNSNDPDVGPIGVELAGDQLRLSFYRSLEEDEFIVPEDVVVNPRLSQALGKSSIILKAGHYAVSYEKQKFGEALVDISSR